jgi:Ser/Thr protein kinase RdoA (MazF antagonist)
MAEEQVLEGGNVSGLVVKIGDTVRKPSTAATPSVAAFLTFLHEEGYSGSPQHFGLDEQGRQSLEYISGQLAYGDTSPDLEDLAEIGKLVRQLHDLAARFPSPPNALWDVPIRPDREELICHNDLGPWNLVRSGDRWVFIDWDNAGPSSRLWDLAYTLITIPHAESNIFTLRERDERVVRRSQALLRGYGPSQQQREALPAMMVRRAQAAADFLVASAKAGIQPWTRMYEQGHATFWSAVADFTQRNSQALHDAFVQE